MKQRGQEAAMGAVHNSLKVSFSVFGDGNSKLRTADNTINNKRKMLLKGNLSEIYSYL